MSLVYLWAALAAGAAFAAGLFVGSRTGRKAASAPLDGSIESMRTALEENDREIAQLRFELAARRPSEVRIPDGLGRSASAHAPGCELCNPEIADEELLHGPAWKVTFERILVSLEPDGTGRARRSTMETEGSGWWAPQDSNL